MWNHLFCLLAQISHKLDVGTLVVLAIILESPRIMDDVRVAAVSVRMILERYCVLLRRSPLAIGRVFKSPEHQIWFADTGQTPIV